MEGTIIIKKDLNPYRDEDTSPDSHEETSPGCHEKTSPASHGETSHDSHEGISPDNQNSEMNLSIEELKDMFIHFFEWSKETLSPDTLKWLSLRSASNGWDAVFSVMRDITEKVNQSSMDGETTSQAAWASVSRLLNEGNDQLRVDYGKWKNEHGWLVENPTLTDRIKYLLFDLKHLGAMLSWFVCCFFDAQDIASYNHTAKALENIMDAAGNILDLWHDLLIAEANSNNSSND